MQIIEVLSQRPMTTQEIADRLTDVPKSSIYRHIRALLDGGLLEVAETRPVKGTLEKFYRLAQAPNLTQENLATASQSEHLRYFAMYLANQYAGFANYLRANPQPNFAQDLTGYREGILLANDAEFEQLLVRLREVLNEAAGKPSGEERRLRKIALIVHPFVQGDESHE